MGAERFKIAMPPVDVSKLLMNSPVGGALAGGTIGGLTSLVSGDHHALRDIALGAGGGALHGHLGQQANLAQQQGEELSQRMSDLERAVAESRAASRAAPAAARAPTSPGVFDRLTNLFKGGSLASILPAAAGAPLGALGGRALAARMGLKNPDTGAMIGGITGATLGGLLKEHVEDTDKTPPGAPYALDPTDQDIPAWALQGAYMLRPTLKQGEHKREPIGDILKGEIPGYPVAEAAIKHGPGAAARTFGGMAGGGLLGGGLGALGGYGIEKLIGHQVNNIPGIGMSLPDLLASIGGTIGATKGLRYMKA